MKSLSERRASPTRPSRPIPPRNGSALIKDFVQQSEQRRVACRFARTGKGLTPRPPGHRHAPTPPRTKRYIDDDRLETLPGARSNQEEQDTAAVVEGLFTTKHVHRNRQISLTPAMLPAAAAAAASGLGVNNKPVFTFTRRKLQMESVNSSATPGGTTRGMMASPVPLAMTTSQHIGHRPRVSNLAAKLDAILRSSPWMRRKVVMQTQMNTPSQRGLTFTPSPRLLSNNSASVSTNHTQAEAIDISAGNANEKHRRHRKHGLTDEDAAEKEKRIKIIFQRFVKLWRERKRRSEQAALSMVSGNGSLQQNSLLGSNGRQGGKLRRELAAQSSNVASILSRRVIGEVPALKFFDEGEILAVDQSSYEPVVLPTALTQAKVSEIDENGDPGPPKPPTQTIGDLMVSSSACNGLRVSPQRRSTPRGVCYTLDNSGCRRIKMESGTPIQTSRGAGAQASQNHRRNETVTIERATSKSLRRKMIRRVKVKHHAISRLTDDFTRSRNALTAKLGSQLALRQAEGERMFNKRLSLLLSNNTELPPHMAAKELSLARLRFKKANLQASCQTLAVLGAALHHIETAGEVSGLEISSGEQRFLELLRCAVEGDHALTPLLTDGIRAQFTPEQRQKPLVAGLLGLLERAATTEA
ncbi:hypothetical protein P3T76_003564 [Phytophthora citrophthora]|uniref:Uncharacterized protein n=1 Tax=Phytophthora citrophthora TaxID=4793 RepID=A0AAD9GVV4_9STRA|nr:hypothetical protein P3T76_003564 [Phytophthora citrophthora]